tara:strand:+ start:35 stop:529 length:495 start_codon:yes stop_codon:yes gene_type:complete
MKNKSNAWTTASQKVNALNILTSDKEIIINLFKKAYENNNIELRHIGTRKREFIYTQAILATVMYEYFKLTLKQVGFIIGKHHATTIHYINLYEDTICLDKKSRELYELLSNYVNKELHGINGSKSYDISSKDNKDLKILCKNLIIENKELRANMYNIRALINV